MHDFMPWMQASALGRFMPESGAWTYAIVNLAHVLGVSSLFGSILVLGNPFLLIKFPAIGLGLINVLVLTRSPAWQARATRA